MSVRQTPRRSAVFEQALASLKSATWRPELRLSELSAPAHLAPYTMALGAQVLESRESDATELATGRFVLLHDPAGEPKWHGDMRIVTFIRAQIDAVMGNDELASSVAWSWLLDALAEHRARYTQAGGTATRQLSQSFGTLSTRADTIDIELRASWTPEGPDMRAHLEAWSTMICSFAGLPPLPEGVSALPGVRLN